MPALDNNFLIETESDKVLYRIITAAKYYTKGWFTELLILRNKENVYYKHPTKVS